MGLVKLFLLEEVRLRRSFSTALSLLIFPEIILVGALAGYIFVPLLMESITYDELHLAILSGLLLFGISMGGIAFLGKEFLERSLGPVNMFAASSAYHPVGEKKVFFAYFLHDLIFYLLLILLPMTLGFGLGAIVRPMDPWRFLLITSSQWSSFLLGLSLSMLVASALSGKKGWRLLVIPASLLPLLVNPLVTGEPWSFLPPVLAVSNGSPFWILITLVLSSVYAALGVALYESGAFTSRVSNPGSYSRTRKMVSKLIRDPIGSSLLSRELMNLLRSKAYIRISFSLLFPLIVMGGLVAAIGGLDQNTIDFNMPFFAIMVSFFTMSIYTNLVNMDFLEYDQTIPVRTPDLIRVKIKLFMMIAIPVSLLFLLAAGALKQDLMGLLFSIPLVLIMVPYMGYVTAYLTGLWTNSMLFDSSVFLRYIGLTVMPLMMATLLSFLMGRIFLVSIVGIGLISVAGLVSTMFLSRSIDSRWSDTVLGSAGNGSE
ncbi:MAG: hypothetical protein ACMUHB_04435 [Thermoplasmatota archaeon]